MKQFADSDMVKKAVGDDNYDALQEPPRLEASINHALWPLCRKALMDIYDPEIPTNIYELGLILKVVLTDDADAGVTDVFVVWDPVWDPSFMSETAKMELNMF